MPKSKKSKLKRHRRSVVKELSKKLEVVSITAAEVIREVSRLPQLDLYQERKTFWDSVAREHKNKIQDFIDCLSKKYSALQ